MMTSVEVRQNLVEALELDLIGPHNEHPFAKELLPESPTRWYLTGFLVPADAPMEQRHDETSDEELDAPADGTGADDDEPVERVAARRKFLPSSMGVSVLVGPDTETLKATVMWGDYDYESEETIPEPAEPDAASSDNTDVEGKENAGNDKPVGGRKRRPYGWRRIPQTQTLNVVLAEGDGQPLRLPVAEGNGLEIVVNVRPAEVSGLPAGTRAVSVFLVNYRPPNTDYGYKAFAFQTKLELACDEGFVPRPDPRDWSLEDEWDQRVADLQFRDVCEFAVGHNIAAEAATSDGEVCRIVRTTWVPTAQVHRVDPADIPDIELGMEALGALTDGTEAKQKLGALVTHYRNWIKAQHDVISSLTESRAAITKDMLTEAGVAADRIQAGIDLLGDEVALKSFRIANRTIAAAARQRFGLISGIDPSEVSAPAWRPFQLAFLLMTMRGIVEPRCDDRDRVDLLFFPTGGGKTEAYLGLAAFTLVLRRLRHENIGYAGVTVLMRYTLRLLTLDQLGRAAGLICALELEREKDAALGKWPFEIGLWVGQAATPNRLGGQGYKGPGKDYTAYTKLRRFHQDTHNPAPIPLEDCPWCGTKFKPESFRLAPNQRAPLDLQVHCANHECPFCGDRALPIVAVDDPLYRRLPCFLIATVDKFAGLPWTGRTGALFGKVDRYDKDGFYGPCDPGCGRQIPDGHLPPPELIIQDELHLISGPLGTIAGLYETAIDALSIHTIDGQAIRSKIVASTATVRRADTQICALFGRPMVSIFPPPGPDRHDSFFARTDKSPELARLYVGLAAQGRSLKELLLRASLTLLSAGQQAWNQAGEPPPGQYNPADPYMTLLCYFSSLRELGGSRRIIEDQVIARLQEYGRRRRLDPEDHLFRNRYINYDAMELTSRVDTGKIAEAKRRLGLMFHETKPKERVDVALATNMISVGLDITRLGLMAVLGQPKTTSEYIQATSRVGRDRDRPGLVVTLQNVHRPRDRSHYERFACYHETFYRNVEATSVTPFSPRALDRALSAALVSLCRQGMDSMTPSATAQNIVQNRNDLDWVAELFANRAEKHRSDLTAQQRHELKANVLHRCNDLLDAWHTIAQKAQQAGSSLKYQKYESSSARALLHGFLDPDLLTLPPIWRKFRANRSMRDVEASVDIRVKQLHEWGGDDNA
jgi:hypothetical protein